jgi:hypothetical protein
MAVQRGRTEEVAVNVGPTVLGEIQLVLYFREEEFIANHQKKGAMLGSCWSNKSTTSPQYGSFMWMGDEIGELPEMLLHLLIA